MSSQQQTGPSPYVAARREWDERYGDFLTAAKNWKMVAFLSLSVAGIAVVCAVYLATQNRVIPYIVEIDKLGTVLRVQEASASKRIDIQKIIPGQLAGFIKKSREVVLDARLQRQNILDAYIYIPKNAPAATKLNQFFIKNDPFERARATTVFTKIRNILPLKDKVFEIEWKEIVMDRKNGKTISNDNYKAVFYIDIASSQDSDGIIKNPTGLIIKDFNWSKGI